MFSKRASKIVSAALAGMMAFQTAAASADDRGVPEMNSDFVENALSGAMERAGCRIVKRDNLLGVMGDERHQKEGRSCHNVGKAIDIFPHHVQCEDRNLKGREKLEAIRDNINILRWPFLTVCGPNGKGPCRNPAAHQEHLHVGLREILNCKAPL